MSTLLDVKKAVASSMGKSDWATPNTVRDQKILDAFREFGTAKKWNCAKITISATFPQAFPAGYSPSFDPGEAYKYVGTEKTPYIQVPLEDLSSYAAGDFVFAIDNENSKIVSSEATGTVTYTKLQVPSSDSEAIVYPDITPICALATAMCWLSLERDEDNYDRFMAKYEKGKERAIAQDNRLGAPRSINNTVTADLGWNR